MRSGLRAPLRSLHYASGRYAAAKEAARQGKASLAIRRWLFKTDEVKAERLTPPERDKLWEFSTATPPKTLTRETVAAGVEQLSARDPRLARIITRVGVDAIYMQVAPSAVAHALVPPWVCDLYRAMNPTDVVADE